VKRGTLVVVALLVVGLYVAPFAVDATDSPEPVRFGETVRTGLTTETVRSAQSRGHVVPKVQTFYAQYQHVVGYYGVESYVATATREGRDRRFGPPVAVYVTEFSGTDPRLADDGFLEPADGASPSWVRAADATYAVVEPSGTDRAAPTVVPFADSSDARAFVATHGGNVRTWSGLLTSLDVPERSANRGVQWPAERDSEANATVADVTPMLDRPVSVVVGEDAPTIQAAVRQAPPNTTVYVPAGRYEERVTVTKPLTLAGAGADTVVDGSGEGTVVVVQSPGVAVASMRLTGVGTETVSVTENASGWDSLVEQTYGRGDAGVAFMNTSRALVSDVSVSTPSNGLLFRDTDRAVVTNVTVRGHPDEATGYMGVMAMRSPVVVQDSTFVDGLDAVYAHRANGMVVRDNEMRDARFGVHLMFTSGTLLADNTVREMDTGLVVMTRPARNAIVGNDVRESNHGVVTAGADSYVADNVLTDNRVGLKIGSRSSLYEGNVLANNAVGVTAANFVASNRVVGNDFLDNGEHVRVVAGPRRVWSANGRGNYWDTAAAGRGGVVAAGRPYSPTDPVTAALHRPGRLTLARSPAYLALEALRGAVPGMRDGGVVDESPAGSPMNANVTASTTATASARITATDATESLRTESTRDAARSGRTTTNA
jgi:nitrous oxidase accessory protein NosD/nitrous oxide reductase accessory protein NosL